MMLSTLLMAVVLAAASAVCAVVPSTGQVVGGASAECHAAALEVRFQLNHVANLDSVLDEDEYHLVRDKVRDFAKAQAGYLDVCEEGAASSPSKGHATECVTVERTYQDGTSEINAYGVCEVES